MKKIVLMVFACLFFAAPCGCDANVSPQPNGSGSKPDDGISTGQAEETAHAEDPYETIAGFYRDYIYFEGDRDEALERFLADIQAELDIGGEASLYELESSMSELFGAAAGYAVCDINGDGSPELLVISEDDYSIAAIYAKIGKNPVLVGAYWSRNRCVIDKGGTIYVSGSSGADDSFSASYWLCAENGDLELIEMVGMESYDGQTLEELPEPRYYLIQNGAKTIISEKEAVDAWGGFPDVYPENPTRDAGLPYKKL